MWTLSSEHARCAPTSTGILLKGRRARQRWAGSEMLRTWQAEVRESWFTFSGVIPHALTAGFTCACPRDFLRADSSPRARNSSEAVSGPPRVDVLIQLQHTLALHVDRDLRDR